MIIFVIALFCLFCYVLYSVWKKTIIDYERKIQEQKEIQKAFKRNNDFQQLIIVIDDMAIFWHDKTKKWVITERFINFAHRAHCLLHPTKYLQRKTFTERLRVFADYKKAIYQTPREWRTRKYWTQNDLV